MNIFVDCEFTDLDLRKSKLISVGLVSEAGDEFYFEITDGYKPGDCSLFVLDEVIPHLDNEKYGLTRDEAANSLEGWLKQFKTSLNLISDAPQYDIHFINRLLEDFNCDVLFNSQQRSIDYELLDDAVDEYFYNDLDAVKHHALHDARALKFAFEKHY
ncbi:MAG: hypothetical protein VW548_04650 [Methylotenera sp.]